MSDVTQTRTAESVLERLERLAGEASGPPWRARDDDRDSDDLWLVETAESVMEDVALYVTQADAALIAEARNALPALVAVARAAQWVVRLHTAAVAVPAIPGALTLLEEDIAALRSALARLSGTVE